MSNIIVAGAYRSGSSHIAESLARYLGSKRTWIGGNLAGYGMDPQRLEAPVMDTLFTRFSGMVYLAHIQGTFANVGLIKAFDPHVIVVTRKLFPQLHSLRRYEEFLFNQGTKFRHLNSDWGEFDNEQKWRWLAYNVIPWSYAFHVSWLKAEGFRKYMTSFEEHFKDQMTNGLGMLQFLGVDVSLTKVHGAFFHKDANYMKDRTEYPMPDFVRTIAYDQAMAWGPWTHRIVEDLL